MRYIGPYTLGVIGATLLITSALLTAYDDKPQQITDQQQEINELQQDLSYVTNELQRDDDIFMTVFGDDWRRSKPMYRTTVRVTAYSSRVKETDSTPRITSSGAFVRPGIIALSNDLREMGLVDGQAVFLVGYGIKYVEDSMHPRKKKQVDVWMGDTKAAMKHGVNTTTLMWFGKGEGDDS